MDKSAEYKIMCLMATELQALKPAIELGDYVVSLEEGVDPAVKTVSGIDREKAVWLPRLDQLIELQIRDENTRTPYMALHYGIGEPCYAIKSILQNMDSFEKLYLVHFMWDTYRKTWEGTEWVKDKYAPAPICKCCGNENVEAGAKCKNCGETVTGWKYGK